jgi:gluconate 2-dehydrogenase alpha chain
MQGECPAYRQNFADLDPTYTDAYGQPLLRITFNFTDNERKIVRYVADRALAQIIGQMNPAIPQVSDTIRDFQRYALSIDARLWRDDYGQQSQQLGRQ